MPHSLATLHYDSKLILQTNKQIHKTPGSNMDRQITWLQLQPMPNLFSIIHKVSYWLRSNETMGDVLSGLGWRINSIAFPRVLALLNWIMSLYSRTPSVCCHSTNVSFKATIGRQVFIDFVDWTFCLEYVLHHELDLTPLLWISIISMDLMHIVLGPLLLHWVSQY